MSAFYRTVRLLILALTSVTPALTLSGCIGGPIAQQIARSIITHGADKIINNAYEAQERETELHTTLKDTPPDPYYYAFITSSFKTITPTVEPLPTSANAVDGTALIASENGTASPTNSHLAPPRVTRLVHVEIWNLIIGDEKNALLEKARMLGGEVPPKDEWQRWRLATGALVSDKNKPITFLIPPEFGRVSSGDHAIVEMVELNQMHMARYAAN